MSFREYFLDANAHLPLNNKALQAYGDFCKSPGGHGHPSSPSQPGNHARVALEKARDSIAKLIGAEKSGNIIFTSSCTQACEWGLEIFFQKKLKNLNEKEYLVVRSPVEHPAVKEAFDVLNEDIYCNENYLLSINKDGLVSVNGEDTFDKVCCIHIQNEIGVIQPIQNIKCEYLFSDMSQSLGKIPVNVKDLNVDIATFGSHKFGGPGGHGFMYLKNPQDWESHGSGSRYFLDRPGTPDVASAVATAVALEEAISSLEERTKNMISFQTTLEQGLKSKGYEIVGEGAPRSPGTTFVRIPDKGLYTVMKLGEHGIHVGLGSACGSMHTGESPLMEALGCEGGVHDFMRISQFGEYNDNDAKHFLTVLNKVL